MTETSVPLGAASVMLPPPTEVTFPTRPRSAARAPGPPPAPGGGACHRMVPSRTVPSRNAPGVGTGLRPCRRTRTSRWWRWPGSPRTLPGPAPWRDHLRPGSSGPDVVGTIRSVRLRARCRSPVRTGLPGGRRSAVGGQDRRVGRIRPAGCPPPAQPSGSRAPDGPWSSLLRSCRDGVPGRDSIGARSVDGPGVVCVRAVDPARPALRAVVVLVPVPEHHPIEQDAPQCPRRPAGGRPATRLRNPGPVGRCRPGLRWPGPRRPLTPPAVTTWHRGH